MIPFVKPGANAADPEMGSTAAAVVCSEAFARRHGISSAVTIIAQAMTTDTPSTFGEGNMMKAVGADMAKAAATQVDQAAGLGPDDVDVVELHDCFTMSI